MITNIKLLMKVSLIAVLLTSEKTHMLVTCTARKTRVCAHLSQIYILFLISLIAVSVELHSCLVYTVRSRKFRYENRVRGRFSGSEHSTSTCTINTDSRSLIGHVIDHIHLNE
jgi:hypothetical protein